jgi:hypothetical protein
LYLTTGPRMDDTSTLTIVYNNPLGGDEDVQKSLTIYIQDRRPASVESSGDM